MEQDLNENFKESNYESKDFFKLEHKNQNVSKFPEFKKWYEKTYQYIKEENIKRGQNYVKNYNLYTDYSLLTIAFCNNCCSYTICSSDGGFCYVKCNKCQTSFCIGCSRNQERFSKYEGDETICFKGYFKLFYLRTIYRRSELIRTCALFNFMHIIFCLFLTPLYIGFISNFMGFLIHPKKKIEKDNLQNKFICVFIYSIFRGLLMFPYIILFLPFTIILLIPGIFSYSYYLYVFDMYITAIWPGTGSLENVGDN